MNELDYSSIDLVCLYGYFTGIQVLQQLQNSTSLAIIFIIKHKPFSSRSFGFDDDEVEVKYTSPISVYNEKKYGLSVWKCLIL